MPFARLALALAFALAIPIPANAASPVLDLVDQPIPVAPDGSLPEEAEVRAAIVRACTVRGWTPAKNEDGTITASIWVRARHYAEVTISVAPTTYSVKYRASKNLDFDERKYRIHRNYNRWVMKLSQTINREFGVRPQTY
jgi:hypothetical protein